MKTLNEVIKANECCDHGEPDSKCENCPYNGIGACCLERETDALYYLKDMKNLEEDYDILYNKYWREFNQQQANSALTWDELKQMEGKPVWVEERSCRLWIIARNFQRVQYENIDTEWLRTDIREIYYDKADIGKTWQAYRKERTN